MSKTDSLGGIANDGALVKMPTRDMQGGAPVKTPTPPTPTGVGKPTDSPPKK